MNIFFDLETIPAPKSLRSVAIESQRKKMRNKDISDDDEALFRSSALSGDFGRILCIGYAIDKESTKVIIGKEEKILESWWKLVAGATCFIGHNILDFDIPFLYKRSVICKIKPSLYLPVKRFQTNNIFDTSKEWSRWDNYSQTSLHNLAIALNIPSSKSGGIDGSQVYDYFLAKKHDEIYKYCMRDVEVTRNIWKRMLYLG